MKKTRKQKLRKKSACKSDKSDTIKKKTQEKQKLFISLYKNKACNVSATCAAVNISRETFYDWLKRYPSFGKKCVEIEESLIDFAETKLMECIQDHNMTAIIFFLTNKGKGRGWKNQYQLKHEGGDPHKPVRVVVQGVDLSQYPKAQEPADSKQ